MILAFPLTRTVHLLNVECRWQCHALCVFHKDDQSVVTVWVRLPIVDARLEVKLETALVWAGHHLAVQHSTSFWQIDRKRMCYFPWVEASVQGLPPPWLPTGFMYWNREMFTVVSHLTSWYVDVLEGKCLQAGAALTYSRNLAHIIVVCVPRCRSFFSGISRSKCRRISRWLGCFQTDGLVKLGLPQLGWKPCSFWR